MGGHTVSHGLETWLEISLLLAQDPRVLQWKRAPRRIDRSRYPTIRPRSERLEETHGGSFFRGGRA